MGTQIITAPNGDRLVVMPEEEYRALVDAGEEAGDLRAVHQFRADLASGAEELMPAEFADRLLDGENPIRVWREFRGLSARALAGKAGVNAAYLSEIENGKKPGSVDALKALADALDVTIDDLI